MKSSKLNQIVFTILFSIISIIAYTNVAEAVICIHTLTEATCTKPKTCTKCQATVGKALGHDYVICGNIARCRECGASKTVSTGTQAGTQTGTQTGNSTGTQTGTQGHIHTFAQATCTMPQTCTVCGATNGKALGHDFTVTSRIDASCTLEGKTIRTCVECGKKETITYAKLGHDYKTTTVKPTCTTAGKTVKACTRCDDKQETTIAKLGHDYKTTTTAATCTKAGKTVKVCARCDDKQETTIAKLGHDYKTTAIAATCTTAGKTVKACTRCDDKQETTIAKLGHDYKTTTTAATCTKVGKTVKACTRCDDKQETTIAKLGHNYKTTTIAATCTKAGKTVKACTRCDDKQETTIAKLGHDYKTTTTAATCTKAGKTVKACTRCDDKQETTIAKINHDYKVTTNISASCTVAGKVIKTCKMCGDTQTSNAAKLEHDCKTTTIEPTCTTSGKTIKACKNCDYKEEKYISPLGHNYVITTTTATCTTPGKTIKKCSICEQTQIISGSALGHDFVETSKIEPTCEKAGKIVKECTRCEEKQEITIPATGHKESIVFNTTHHWFECDICNIETSDRELHDYDEDNICKVCGYHNEKDTPSNPEKPEDPETPEDPEEPEDPTDNEGDLIIEPWMKENDKLNCLAVSLRSEPYEEDRANKNIYALDEKVIYYVDYKNGAKTTNKKVTLQLTLPLSFSVVDSDGATVSRTKKTFTWTFNGMEEDEAGTKVVVIKYTSLGKSSITYKTITPKATISLASTEKDVSAVLNLVVKDFNTEVEDEHEPYMYGDKDTKNFRPDDTIKRGEGALVLTRIFGISTKYDNNTYAFPDLNQTYLEARKAVMAATAYGIIEGYPDGTYRPNKPMTRGEFMTILARQIEEKYGEGFEVKDEDELIKVYKDKNRLYYISEAEYYNAHWSVSYATLLARLNMTPLTEKSTNLRVDDPITRAEVAQLVNFYLLRAPAEVTSSTKTQFPDVSKRHELFADIVEATRKAHNYSITEDGTEEDE